MRTRRRFIRHPSDVPIECYSEVATAQGAKEHLRDVSEAGLSFRSPRPVEAGVAIEVRIPFVDPLFQARGRVVWCKETGRQYDVGVEFTGGELRFRLRMVEQICEIEHYRMRIRRREHRELSGEEAAREWIERYADRYPTLSE